MGLSGPVVVSWCCRPSACCSNGHHELVKYLADSLLFCASLLSVVAALLGIVTLPDRRQYAGLTWRARFVAENRRHPRVRVIQLVCLTAAVVLLITVLLIIAPALSRFIYR